MHPYLKASDFRDPGILRVRRRVALLLLPYATGRQRAQLEKLVALYDELLS